MERLRELRRAKGWSQQRLADEAGVDRTTISFAENDVKRPHLDTVEKLADALGVEPGELLSKPDPEETPPEPEPEPEPEIDPVVAMWLEAGRRIAAERGVEVVTLTEKPTWNPEGASGSGPGFIEPLPRSVRPYWESPDDEVRAAFDQLVETLRRAGASAAEIARVERERQRALREIGAH